MLRWLILISLYLLSLSLSANPSVQTLTPLPEPIPAPDFQLADLDGQRHTLSALRGKVVIVNFWATWCPPCREEMPSMQRAWEQLRNRGVVMLAINVGEDEDTVFNFTANYPVDFPLLLDEESQVINQWPVRGLPSTFVIDNKGRIIYRAIGGREWDSESMLAPVRALLR